MSEEKPTNAAENKPNSEPLIDAPYTGTTDEQVPSPNDVKSAPYAQDDARKLEQDIKKGESWLIGIAAAGVVVNIIIAYFYYSQLGQMRVATQAATKAANVASESLEFSNGNFDRMMQRTIDQTTAQLKSSKATQDAADAAQKTAQIGKESLQVSQRAYLEVGDPVLDQKPLMLHMPLINLGHIPAVDVVITAYEESLQLPSRTPLDKTWTIFRDREIPVTGASNPGYGLDAFFRKVEFDNITKGERAVIYAGTIEYNDGFPDTPRQTTWFCTHSYRDDVSGNSHMMPCDAITTIPAIKKDIDYPNNYAEVPK